MKFRGGGATRKTAPACDLTISHSSAKDNLSPKPLKKTCLEEFYEKMKRHSGLDPESINADKDRLRLGGRSDECGQITNSSFRHSELVSESLNKEIDSGSEAGVTKAKWRNLHQAERNRKAAFTMAEVLITLGIIGIVAAMTLPSLITNYQKKVIVTQLKRTYTVLSQAVERSIADYGDPSGWGLEGYFKTQNTQENQQYIIENFTRTYIVPYLAKLQKSEWGAFKDFGYTKIQESESSRMNYLTRKGYMLALNDGTIMQVSLSTQNYGGPDEDDRDDRLMDVIIIADVNGKRGPNTAGKDLFLFKIGTQTGKFEFFGYNWQNTREDVWNNCKINQLSCGKLIIMDGWEMKDDYPAW